MLAQVEALKGQHRNLDLAVRGLQDQRRQLAEIQAHDARKFRRARRAPRLITLPLIQMRAIQRIILPLRIARQPPPRAGGGAAVRARCGRGAGALRAPRRGPRGRPGGGPGPRAEGARRPAAWARCG
jgi:hypothetical protein